MIVCVTKTVGEIICSKLQIEIDKFGATVYGRYWKYFGKVCDIYKDDIQVKYFVRKMQCQWPSNKTRLGMIMSKVLCAIVPMH